MFSRPDKGNKESTHGEKQAASDVILPFQIAQSDASASHVSYSAYFPIAPESSDNLPSSTAATELDFHEIDPSFYDDAGISKKKPQYPAPTAAPPQTRFTAFGIEGGPTLKGGGSWWRVSSYREYFSVSESDVLERMTSVFLPFKKHLLEEHTNMHPDLYGPFWTATTLILSLAVASNLYTFFANTFVRRKSSLELSRMTPLDFQNLWVAGCVFYAYPIIASVSLWLYGKYLSCPTGLVYTISVYGYSLLPIIPTALLAVIPSKEVEWVLFAVGFGISSLFLFCNLMHDLHLNEEQPGEYGSLTTTSRTGFIRLLAVVLHVLVGLFTKMYFF